ncbi:hypothetical protein HD806DRAFT_338838 [Xylariaceae sp. AK1471]|nr:hypothetical protein HD806DRAFT_338838 [Xylariaceae sp. AK1471]
MTVMALTALVVKAWFTLSIASLASLASAQDATDATIVPVDGLTDSAGLSLMQLSILPIESGPYGPQYNVAPLTSQAGKQLSGNLVILDQTNFTQVDKYWGNIIYLSCDPNTAVSNINRNDVLNKIMENSQEPHVPKAILLYSTQKAFCQLGGSHLIYNNIWTMTSSDDAIKVQNAITQSTDSVMASITSNATTTSDTQIRPGGNSAIAMSILYSITGLITILFLLIIATGAVRAHRNPERYGPRASTNGRPRRSRARGLAMAMLETLPIVKFGESDSRKPDEENALENVSRVEPQQQEASHVTSEGASNNTAIPKPSSEAANDTISQHEPEDAHVPANTAPETAKNEPALEANHLGCSICTEDFTVGEDVRVLPCNHKFHPACVDPWLVNVSGTCPLCRLDLRPPEDIEPEESGEAAAQPDGTDAASGHLAPPAETEQAPEPAAAAEATHRRRRSRLLDWNRLRHAPVDERIQALRQYRQSQQGATEDERRHSRLTDRLRERFHIRGESRSSTATPENPLPAVSTVQH